MAQYLPVLLVSVSAVSSNLAPDDSSLDTQAIAQVDYLSHHWQEEDVAKSWRNMTRRKDSIQNGARLENASWRTWWKQRNNLPTVSPETLNWLKDSDVTWLYGPLHTAADWAPPPRHSLERDISASSPSSPPLRPSPLPNNLPSHPPRSSSPWSLKPILKHRSISELLSISLPPSPATEYDDDDDDDEYYDTASADSVHQVSSDSRKRPKLIHTKSDSTVHQRNPFRRESPPLPLAARSSDSSSGESASSTQAPRGRHISFNTFVEQCIAIEKPKKATYDDDSYNEHVDGYPGPAGDSEDDDESDDDVLEMRPTSRSRTPTTRRFAPFSGATTGPTWSHDVSSPEREHVTIAPIAPTVLKSSPSPSPVGSFQYGHAWEEEEMEYMETSFAHGHNAGVNLVYVPPQGSVYAERLAAHSGKSSPPKLETELRSASFDEVLLQGRINPSVYAPLGNFFELPGVHDDTATCSNIVSGDGRPIGRDSAAEVVEETHWKCTSGNNREDGTVVPPLPSVAISPPHLNEHAGSSSSSGCAIPCGASTSTSVCYEPQSRGRSASPINARDRDPPRGRSLSRGSVDGSVSPRSESHKRLGRRASTSLGASPSWRDTSVSPEEGEGGTGARKGSRRRDGGSMESLSPPNRVQGSSGDYLASNEGAAEEGTSMKVKESTNPTPCNSPTVQSTALPRASSEEPVTLVGRAVDIVSSARGYLGSFWRGGERLPGHVSETVGAGASSVS